MVHDNRVNGPKNHSDERNGDGPANEGGDEPEDELEPTVQRSIVSGMQVGSTNRSGRGDSIPYCDHAVKEDSTTLADLEELVMRRTHR